MNLFIYLPMIKSTVKKYDDEKYLDIKERVLDIISEEDKRRGL